jgi:hypothetical protein
MHYKIQKKQIENLKKALSVGVFIACIGAVFKSISIIINMGCTKAGKETPAGYLRYIT